MTPVTLITGASAGIGMELARVFASRGHALVLVARREQRLNELAAEIAATGRAKPVVLAMDLAESDAAARIGAALARQALEPQYIVNNAGFGLVGHVADLDRAEQLDMIDLNTRALTDLSLSFVDSLARHRGGTSMWLRSLASCPVLARPCTTPARPLYCRSPRRCMMSLSRAASVSAASAPARWLPNFRLAPESRKPSRHGRSRCLPRASPLKVTVA
jgi:NAD(P)-dependent dehydrogenase (short-subunit alcohol dehydrogenase family)